MTTMLPNWREEKLTVESCERITASLLSLLSGHTFSETCCPDPEHQGGPTRIYPYLSLDTSEPEHGPGICLNWVVTDQQQQVGFITIYHTGPGKSRSFTTTQDLTFRFSEEIHSVGISWSTPLMTEAIMYHVTT